MTPGPDDEQDSDIDDVLEDLEELESIVDRPEEREQVREAMRTARRADRPRVFGRIRSSFDLRDAGEALVGSFLFGIPMIVEEGTLEVGAFVATSPLYLAVTIGFGLALVLGILHSGQFHEIEADMLLGFVPVRLISIIVIATSLGFGLMTIWGRVDWSDPMVAFSQCTVTTIVMAVGASLGDILPE